MTEQGSPSVFPSGHALNPEVPSYSGPSSLGKALWRGQAESAPRPWQPCPPLGAGGRNRMRCPPSEPLMQRGPCINQPVADSRLRSSDGPFTTRTRCECARKAPPQMERT